jgi:hypothetical protein
VSDDLRWQDDPLCDIPGLAVSLTRGPNEPTAALSFPSTR